MHISKKCNGKYRVEYEMSKKGQLFRVGK